MKKTVLLKTITLLIAACFALSKAQQYSIFDMNGKNRGSFKGVVNKHTIAKFTKEYHGSVLVKKHNTNTTIKNLNQKQLNSALINHVQQNVEMYRDSLKSKKWLEVEKNEIVKICLDNHVHVWETSINSIILNDSCLVFQVPTLIGVDTLKMYFPDEESPNNIYLAIGMKYLKFENEEVLLGFNKYNETELYALGYKNNHDPERLVTITGSYLVDKYPVTNCDIIQTMWDNLPSKKTSFTNWNRKRLADEWVTRKRNSTRNGTCDVHDSAACTILLLQSIKYANARSIREGLKPYYTFSSSNKVDSRIISKGNYIIGYFDFTNKDEGKEEIQVSIDSTSDGYRLPFYDEWMMFARGGDKKKQAPWSDSATFEEASKYAQLGPEWHYDKSKPVGQLLPNGYGLYDMLGLVEEHVLFEEKNPFSAPRNKPSCVKGANDRTEQEWKPASKSSGPYWKDVNYGYYRGNDNEGLPAGFRLIRNIGNNAKWTEVKSDKE